MIRVILLVSLAALSAVVAAADEPVAQKKLDVVFPLIDEMSGLAKSRRFDDVYWMHNDSGGSARLFPADSDGRIIFPAYLSGSFYGEEVESGKQRWPGLGIEVAANIDWEDIAVDDDYLYIAEMGNNGNSRRDLGVYVVPEPNPRQVSSTRALKFVPVAYPAQRSFSAERWHYDSEAIFVDDGTLYFLTKHRQPGKIDQWERGTVLYRLESMEPGQVNPLQRVDANERVTVVTGADLSPDGTRLAVLCYLDLWIFERPREDGRWLSGDAYRVSLDLGHTGQAEAVTWMDDERILIGNEGSEWFTVAADEVPRFDP